MSANVMAFSKAAGYKYSNIPSLTLIFEDEAPYPHDYEDEARRIAQYMKISLPSATVAQLAEELTKIAKEIE
jgi:hypothetical protein